MLGISPVDPSATPASEDFGSFGADWHVHSVFRFVAGTNPETHAKAKDIAFEETSIQGMFVSLSDGRPYHGEASACSRSDGHLRLRA
jgi:hypothetical protein